MPWWGSTLISMGASSLMFVFLTFGYRLYKKKMNATTVEDEEREMRTRLLDQTTDTMDLGSTPAAPSAPPTTEDVRPETT